MSTHSFQIEMIQRRSRFETRASVASRRSRPSIFKPAGNIEGLPPPREVGPFIEFALLAFFTLQRALHPVIIESAKLGQPKAPYSKVTPVLVECAFTMLFGQILCILIGGKEQWRRIWDPTAMKIFSGIGIMYAIGDILEVAALAKVSGDAYQILSQSKLLITALMMWAIKGTRQTRLQWILLATLMVAMSVYMTSGNMKNCPKGSADDKNAEGFDKEYFIGISLVALKVIQSCLGAVLADKYLKEYKHDPIYLQLVRLRVSWFVFVLLYTFFDQETWSRSGPFTGWGIWTCAVLVSFIVKGWVLMYLLAILDSLLKNIGEAISVLVTFALSVWVFNKYAFNMPTFFMVMAVTLTVVAYIDAKGVIEKARKFEGEHDDA